MVHKVKIVIYETDHFLIRAADRPFIDRSEGGHIYIDCKLPIRDRTKLSPSLAIEYTKLSIDSWGSPCLRDETAWDRYRHRELSGYG